jgi:hypothetical protein
MNLICSKQHGIFYTHKWGGELYNLEIELELLVHDKQILIWIGNFQNWHVVVQ